VYTLFPQNASKLTETIVTTTISQSMAMHHSHPSPKAGDPYRGLRIVAIFDSIAATAMLLPCGIITHKTWPVLGVAPMFFSAVFQVTTIGASPRMPKMTIFINLLLAASLLSVLLPRSVGLASLFVAQITEILL
jgi:hypothetical protein